jgi:hypothetical protein
MITATSFKKMVQLEQMWLVTNHLTKTQTLREIAAIYEKRLRMCNVVGECFWVYFPREDEFRATGIDSFDVVNGRDKILSFKLYRAGT